MKELLHIIFIILGFVIVLFLAKFTTKFLGKKMSYSKTTKHIRVVDRMFIGNDKSICIIQIGNRFFAVGITNQHVDLICELSEADLMPLSVEEESPFNSLFDMYTSKFRHNRKKNDDDRNVDRI